MHSLSKLGVILALMLVMPGCGPLSQTSLPPGNLPDGSSPTPSVPEPATPPATVIQPTPAFTAAFESTTTPDVVFDPAVNAGRIHFPANGTWVEISDSISTSTIKRYVLSALQGQIMSVSVRQGPAFSVHISGLDQVTLSDPLQPLSFWRGRLPSTQDYIVSVESQVSGPFTLRIAIAPPGKASQDFEFIDPRYAVSLIYMDTFAPTDVQIPIDIKGSPLLTLTFTDPSFYAPRTNLIETYLQLAASADPAVVSTCTQPSTQVPETVTGSVNIHNHAFTRSEFSGAAAGNRYDQVIYRSVWQDKCFEVVFLIHSANIGNYPAGTVVEFDRAALINQFETVLNTFTTSTPSPMSAFATPELARIDFQDEYNGWGIDVSDGGHILRTFDGGAAWLDVTPPGSAAIGYSTTLEVIARTAWVLEPGADFFSGTLFRTGDDGATWISSPVPFGGAFIQFLDDSTGRALAVRGAGAGSEAVELFQTSDGGVTWVSVFHNDPSQSGSSDSLPLAGIKNGMTFLDANTGWVTGSIPADGQVYLYVTRDGGVSWSQQDLPLPPAYAPYQYLPRAPVFFGKDGFLPLTVELPGKIDFTFFITHNGGLTWSGDPADDGKAIQPGLPAIADALHIWSWDGGATLYQSSDGAQTWKGIPASPDLSGRLAQLELVPAVSGRFTGWALTRADETGHSQLYRSLDGSTWTPLIH